MLTIDLMGGLGNQLFQIFTLIAYSKKYNQKFLIEKKNSFPGSHVVRHGYWDSILEKLSDNLVSIPLKYQIVSEKGFEYNDLQIPNSDVKLRGYFQSYKYFETYRNEIINMLDLKTKTESVLQKMNIDTKNMVSLHFRVGDYIHLPNHHPIMTLKYYSNAIRFILNKDNDKQLSILYFCENSDIEYVLKEFINPLCIEFPSLTFLKADGSKLEDWEQMLFMSCCKHNIIANSSFSWWAAYFNDNSEKIICYPETWFGLQLSNHNTSDMCPKSWNKIKNI